MHGSRTGGRSAASFLLSLLVLAAGPLAAQRAVARITVDAGGHERTDVPVTAVLTGVPLHLGDGQLRLFETTGGKQTPVASQLRAGAPDELAWILAGRTAAGSKRTFELRSVADAPPAAAGARAVQVADDGNALKVTLQGKPVLEYRYTPMPVPEGVKPIFSSSAFIHPLWSPGGEVLTRIQPPDHRHHYGIQTPWTHTEFQGRQVDYWNLGSGQGRVRSAAILERVDGDVLGGFHTLHEHVDQTAPGGDVVSLHEQWDVTVWNVPGTQKAWLIDFVSTLNPATDSTFTIKEYRYQGFSLRATPRWNDSTATILTSQGKDKSNANATRARWLEVDGVADVPEGRAGVLFLSNPSNFNFPEPLRVWPTGENHGKENVYVNFNPAQDRDWVLRPGHTYVLKYRMYVHDGVVDAKEAERLWTDFAEPPHVTVQPVGDATE